MAYGLASYPVMLVVTGWTIAGGTSQASGVAIPVAWFLLAPVFLAMGMAMFAPMLIEGVLHDPSHPPPAAWLVLLLVACMVLADRLAPRIERPLARAWDRLWERLRSGH